MRKWLSKVLFGFEFFKGKRRSLFQASYQGICLFRVLFVVIDTLEAVKDQSLGGNGKELSVWQLF